MCNLSCSCYRAAAELTLPSLRTQMRHEIGKRGGLARDGKRKYVSWQLTAEQQETRATIEAAIVAELHLHDAELEEQRAAREVELRARQRVHDRGGRGPLLAGRRPVPAGHRPPVPAGRRPVLAAGGTPPGTPVATFHIGDEVFASQRLGAASSNARIVGLTGQTATVQWSGSNHREVLDRQLITSASRQARRGRFHDDDDEDEDDDDDDVFSRSYGNRRAKSKQGHKRRRASGSSPDGRYGRGVEASASRRAAPGGQWQWQRMAAVV